MSTLFERCNTASKARIVLYYGYVTPINLPLSSAIFHSLKCSNHRLIEQRDITKNIFNEMEMEMCPCEYYFEPGLPLAASFLLFLL